MDESTIEVTSRDGIQLQVYRWAPDGEPRAVVQIQHGLGEHALRYKRFAQALTDAVVMFFQRSADGLKSLRRRLLGPLPVLMLANILKQKRWAAFVFRSKE